MKGDVKRQFFTYGRRRRVGLDIQPQTTAVGSKNYVSAQRFHLLGYHPGSILGSCASLPIGNIANHGSIRDSRLWLFLVMGA